MDATRAQKEIDREKARRFLCATEGHPSRIHVNPDTIKEGDPCRWGTVDQVTHNAPGIAFVSTSSHGGFLLSPARLDELPAELKGLNTFGGGPWFEEDCEAQIIAYWFGGLFDIPRQSPNDIARARKFVHDFYLSDKGKADRAAMSRRILGGARTL